MYYIHASGYDGSISKFATKREALAFLAPIIRNDVAACSRHFKRRSRANWRASWLVCIEPCMPGCPDHLRPLWMQYSIHEES